MIIIVVAVSNHIIILVHFYVTYSKYFVCKLLFQVRKYVIALHQ